MEENRIIESDFLFFSDKKKYQTLDKCLPVSKSFNNSLERFDILTERIMEFINSKAGDDVYIAIEGYSYGSTGVIFDIAEATSILKYKIYKSEKNIKLRIYEPTAIKKFAAYNGTSSKVEMGNAFNESKDEYKPNIPDVLPEYESPRADIIDAYWICVLLQTEIALRFGYIALKDLHQKQIEVFNAVSKKNKENLLVRSFIERV